MKYARTVVLLYFVLDQMEGEREREGHSQLDGELVRGDELVNIGRLADEHVGGGGQGGEEERQQEAERPGGAGRRPGPHPFFAEI